MDVVFVTHNRLGLTCLEELHDRGATVQAVITRHQRESISDQTDLSGFCSARGIPHVETDSVNEPGMKRRIADDEPDLLFVIGWSELVDPDVLALPTVAAVGMHPAPLPRGRGRAPIAWSLIKGLDETALSMFHLVEAADAGELIGQRDIPISIEDDAASLYEKVVVAGRELIAEYYPSFEAGAVPRIEQDESRATWWPRRRPHHGLIDWNQTPSAVYNWIRGQSHPYPGAFSYLGDRRVTIWEASPPTGEREFVTPGELHSRDGNVLRVGAWEGTIELRRVQVEGDETVPAGVLIEDYPFELGDRFEPLYDRLS